MKKRHIISVGLLTLLSACMPANTKVDGVVKAGEVSSGPFGMIKSDTVKVDTADAFKGTNDVVIGNFIVGFSTYKTDSAKAGGGLMGSGFGGKSTAKTTLVGIDNATMQKITDKAYAGFVKDLKARGYNVVDRTELMNHEKFKETKTYPNPYEDSSGGLFGASSKTTFVAPTGFGAVRSFMGDIPGTTGGFGFDNPLMGAIDYAKVSGKRVVNVVYVLDFANSDKYGSWSTNSSSVNVGHGMTAVPEYTKLSIIGGDMGTFSSANGNIRLGQPVNSDVAFAEIVNTNSEAYKGVEMATNVVGLLGGIGSNISREYDVKARPADFS